VLGVGAYFLTKSDNDSDNNESSATSQNETDQASTDTPKFNLASTINESFTATVTGTANGETFNATIKNDGEGNSQYSGQANNKEFDLYLLGDRNIICSDGNCIETSNTAGLAPIDRDQYEISDEDLESYQQSAVYKGTADCSAGTCEKWEVSVSEFTGTLLVDNNGRINQVSTVVEGGTYTIDYTYSEVIITPPENVISLPSAQ
jgi:hypothetical protein